MKSPSYPHAMGALCLCCTLIILTAGLWPFHAPRNDVTWLEQENGVRFGVHGTILSASAFETHSFESGDSSSLEIWLAPSRSKGRKTILAFTDSGHTEGQFLLQQIGDALIVQRRNIDDRDIRRVAEITIRNAFHEKNRVLVTINLEPHETSVYLDGVLVTSSEILGNNPGTCSGRLVLGNSVTSSDSWSGQVLGLAIYERELPAARVFQHYQDWTIDHRLMAIQDEGPAALYLFSERSGDVVHNQLGSPLDLNIPNRYLVLHPEFLSLPWRHFHSTWSYWTDAAINIAGFVPFGFFFVAYLSTTRTTGIAAAATILLGFLLSLTIEWLQAHLPTRDSGMNDLITNTLGTALGVLLYRSSLCQNLLRQVLATQLPA
jgi:VanZ family protein